MKLRTPSIGTIAAITLVSPGMADCYTTNCTGSDITGRRSCYLCCAEHCVGDGELDCQESCDSAWILEVDNYFPIGLLNELMESRGDVEAQMSFFVDEDLWKMWTADKTVNIAVIELTDWLYTNAADIKVAKMALVTLSWLGSEHTLTPKGKQLVEDILVDALHSPEWNIRRSAILGIRDTRAYRHNLDIQREIVRMAAQDPNELVRETTRKVLSLVESENISLDD